MYSLNTLTPCVAAVDPEALSDLPAAGEVLHLYQDEMTNITCVSCVNEMHGHEDDLVQVFAHYHKYLNPRSRLFVVFCGHLLAETCAGELRQAIERRRLTNHVVVVAGVSRAELKGYYLISHAFLGLRQSAGVCIPTVQAMFFQVPVVAWNAAALRRTLGDEALVWDELHPAILAQSLHYCLENPEAGEFMADRQRDRYQTSFSPEASRRLFIAHRDAFLFRYAGSVSEGMQTALAGAGGSFNREMDP